MSERNDFSKEREDKTEKFKEDILKKAEKEAKDVAPAPKDKGCGCRRRK